MISSSPHRYDTQRAQHNVNACIELSDVSYGYGRHRRVLNDISMRIPSGCTALVGENGAGKTSLMRVISSLVEADHGQLHINGIPQSKKTKEEYRSHIGWMPQSIPVLPGFSVQESVEYHAWLGKMPRKQIHAAVRRSLEQVHLAQMANMRASTLSGGQLRRLGLAQALVRGADWLLLDEPTAGLDPRQKRSLAQLLANLRGHVNCVISTHDFDHFESLFDHVIVLHNGRLVWQGTTDDYLGLASSDSRTRAFDAFNAVLDGQAALHE